MNDSLRMADMVSLSKNSSMQKVALGLRMLILFIGHDSPSCKSRN
jgi:hypothetical protein